MTPWDHVICIDYQKKRHDLRGGKFRELHHRLRPDRWISRRFCEQAVQSRWCAAGVEVERRPSSLYTSIFRSALYRGDS